jgi:hypothetical protein
MDAKRTSNKPEDELVLEEFLFFSSLADAARNEAVQKEEAQDDFYHGPPKPFMPRIVSNILIMITRRLSFESRGTEPISLMGKGMYA